MLIPGPVQGQSAILRFLHNRPASTPADVRDKLKDLAYPDTTAPVEACVEAIELVYARRADCPVELLALGADLAEMAARHRYVMGEGPTGEAGRGLAISSALRSMDGVSPSEEVPQADAPAPKAIYVPSSAPTSSGSGAS